MSRPTGLLILFIVAVLGYAIMHMQTTRVVYVKVPGQIATVRIKDCVKLNDS